MIPSTVVFKIEELLAQGELSMNKIAARFHVSRASVSAIAHGKRILKSDKKMRSGSYYQNLNSNESKIFYPTGVTARCPECGGLVKTPCLACQLRRRLRFFTEKQ